MQSTVMFSNVVGLRSQALLDENCISFGFTFSHFIECDNDATIGGNIVINLILDGIVDVEPRKIIVIRQIVTNDTFLFLTSSSNPPETWLYNPQVFSLG